MNEYSINGQSLAAYGITATRSGGTSLALSGAWDLPARTGDTSYDWKDTDGTQAYVDADDILFGPRNITFRGLISAGNGKTLGERITDFTSFLGTVNKGIFTLSAEWGSWDVQQSSSVTIKRLDNNHAEFSISLTEPRPDISGTLPVPSGKGDDIDGYTWEELGLYIASVSGALDAPRRKEIDTTRAEGDNTLTYGGLDSRKITISGTLIADNYPQFVSRVRALYVLFAGAGLRTYKYRGNTYRCFAPDGFSVRDVVVSNKTIASWNITLRTANNG